MEKLRLAACGANCNHCGLYNAGHDIKSAESILEWFKNQKWISQDGTATDVQQVVLNKQVSCDGCFGESAWCGCKEHDFRICCNRHKIAHCGECLDFPCEPYMSFANGHENHKKALEYLLSLKASKKEKENEL